MDSQIKLLIQAVTCGNQSSQLPFKLFTTGRKVSRIFLFAHLKNPLELGW